MLADGSLSPLCLHVFIIAERRQSARGFFSRPAIPARAARVPRSPRLSRNRDPRRREPLGRRRHDRSPARHLIHHYKVDESGAIKWANLIVATGHNNLAINHSVGQVARHFIDGNQMKEGMLNRVSAVVRAYDPCLSCSTHADGTPALEIALKGPGAEVLDRL